jgi:molybdate transport system substrate-binding protein
MRGTLIGFALTATLAATSARAADLGVYSGGSLAEPLKTIGADFTRATGRGLSFASGTTGVMLARIRAGEKVDVMILAADGMEALQKEGLILPGSTKPVSSSLLGVAVKAGAPHPDISTPAKFRAAMLNARSIAYPDPALGATSGLYIADLFRQMGIADQMKAKTVVKPVGAQAGAAVAVGEVELAVTFISELVWDSRLEVVGTFPKEILNPSPFVAGIPTASSDPAAARAFIAFVTSPGERAKLKAGGLEPAASP